MRYGRTECRNISLFAPLVVTRRTHARVASRLQLGSRLMPRFYFHQHFNGQFAEDRRGRLFANVKQACEHAVHRTPALLRKIARPTCNTHLAMQISDGRRTLCVVRGKVLIEKVWDARLMLMDRTLALQQVALRHVSRSTGKNSESTSSQ
jgi:hypothetical protein